MTTKADERTRKIMEDVGGQMVATAREEAAQYTLGLVLWGVVCGALAVYLPILPISIGFVIGYAVAYKRLPFFEWGWVWLAGVIGRGHAKLTAVADLADLAASMTTGAAITPPKGD